MRQTVLGRGQTGASLTKSAQSMVSTVGGYEHIPCVAHVVQRAVVITLQEGGFEAALTRVRKVVGHFRHSPANSDELNLQQASLGQDQESLVQDVPTRWNSTLEMIRRVLRNREALQATLSQQKQCLALPTSADYERLSRLEAVLDPCRYVTELLGEEKYISCSVASAHHGNLGRQSRLHRPVQSCLPQGPDQADGELEPGVAQGCDGFGSTFQRLKMPEPSREEASVGEAKRAGEGGRNGSANTRGGDPRVQAQISPAAHTVNSDSESEDIPEDNTVERYRLEPAAHLDQCPLKWWLSNAAAFRRVATVARKYLGTRERLFFERLFSLAGHIVQRRANLSPENLNRLVCLSDWWKGSE